MPRSALKTNAPSSPLMQKLHSLSVLDCAQPHSRFVATIGKFIDFSEAMSLSELLSDLPHIASSNDSAGDVSNNTGAKTGSAGVKAHYLQSRGEMMNFIVQSFITDNCPVSLRLPVASDATFTHEDQGLSAYQRFYALHQSEMEANILKLQAYIRRYMSAHSTQLSQLVVLESKLNEILLAYSRKALGAIPSLLAKRFHFLHFDPPETTEGDVKESGGKEGGSKENTALQTFLVEMQSVLLAELDIRLQPTLGLVEALIREEEESTR